jgi:hypothetical protein
MVGGHDHKSPRGTIGVIQDHSKRFVPRKDFMESAPRIVLVIGMIDSPDFDLENESLRISVQHLQPLPRHLREGWGRDALMDPIDLVGYMPTAENSEEAVPCGVEESLLRPKHLIPLPRKLGEEVSLVRAVFWKEKLLASPQKDVHP